MLVPFGVLLFHLWVSARLPTRCFNSHCSTQYADFHYKVNLHSSAGLMASDGRLFTLNFFFSTVFIFTWQIVPYGWVEVRGSERDSCMVDDITNQHSLSYNYPALRMSSSYNIWELLNSCSYQATILRSHTFKFIDSFFTLQLALKYNMCTSQIY